MKHALLCMLVALCLTGCAAKPTAIDHKKSASVSAGDAVVASKEAVAAASAAEIDRAAIESAVKEALAYVNAAVNFDAKTKTAELLLGAMQHLSTQKVHIAAITKHSTDAGAAAEDASEKSAQNEAELTRFRADDPTLKRIQNSAATMMIAGVVIAVFGVIAYAGLFSTVPWLSFLTGRVVTWTIGAGLGLIGAGLGLYMLADLMVSIRASMKYIAIVVGCGVAAWAVYHWLIARQAARKIVATIDKGVHEGAIVWTPAATKIANEMQGPIVRSVVDIAQADSTPGKPA